MAENITTNNPNEKDESKKKAGKAKKSKFSLFVSEHKSEFKKIVWPGPAEVRKNTIDVVVTSLAIGIIIFGMDTIWGGIQSAAMSLLGLI